jgi:glutamate/tyrosine decarboxylase-like PLP-dependent enzyme
MGRTGTIALVDRLVRSAALIAGGLEALPGVEILNDVVFTQVCAALDTDERTDAWADALRTAGEVFASSSRWQGRSVLRFSVSNWATDDDEVARTLAAASRALP